LKVFGILGQVKKRIKGRKTGISIKFKEFHEFRHFLFNGLLVCTQKFLLS
jgi:hypothetical protein